MTTLRVSRDTRDLAQMLAHVHDAEIEIGEGPEPPPREDSGAIRRGPLTGLRISLHGSRIEGRRRPLRNTQ